MMSVGFSTEYCCDYTVITLSRSFKYISTAMLTAVVSQIQNAVIIQEIWPTLEAFLAICCNYVTARGAVKHFKGQWERI